MARRVLVFFAKLKQALQHLKTKKVFVPLAVLVVCTLVVMSYVYFRPDSPDDISRRNTLAEIKQIESQEAPKDDDEKIDHYSDIALRYEEAGEYQKALDAMLKADQYIKVRTGEKSRSVNNSIGRYYKELGDTEKAAGYFDKEIARLKTIPGNDETIRYYELQKVELDEN